MSEEASWTVDTGPGTSEVLARNWLFELRRERFRSRRTNQAHDHYLIDLADAVLVLAVTPEERLVLVEQFRGGSRRDSLEPPGGLIEAGEDPLAAAARELREETGYEGDAPVILSRVWANPSLMNARITAVVIMNARRTREPNPDGSEEVRTEEVPITRLPRLLREGRIDHALAVEGILWWLVSQIPGTALEQPIARGRRLSKRSIAWLGLVIGCVAVVLGIGRALGFQGTLLVVGAFSFCIASVIVRFVIEPMPRVPLLRGIKNGPRYRLLQGLATIGLAVLIIGASQALFFWMLRR